MNHFMEYAHTVTSASSLGAVTDAELKLGSGVV